MNVVDSCGWLEYFADAQNAEFFAPVIEDTASLIVPAINNVGWVRPMAVTRQSGNEVSMVGYAMGPLTHPTKSKLPMADSLILATARAHAAVLWTQDDDFASIQGVQYIQKHS